MKKLKSIHLTIASLVMNVVIIILSALPNSAVLRFVSMNENGERIVTAHYYSSFEPILIGNANFGPFLSAVMACIMVVVMITMFFVDGIKYKRFALVMSVIGLVVSLFSLIITSITVFSPIISIVWLLSIICNSSLVMKKQDEIKLKNA